MLITGDGSVAMDGSVVVTDEGPGVTRDSGVVTGSRMVVADGSRVVATYPVS